MPAKILVIDGEAGMRQVIAKILVPLGHTLFEADDAAKGIELCRRENPAVVLMDIRLSDMDAPDVLSELKKARNDLPVIVLTGFGDVDAALELVKQGAFGQLSKPFKVENFLNMVNKALSAPLQPPQAAQPAPAKPKEAAKPAPAQEQGKKPAAAKKFILIPAAAAVLGLIGYTVFYFVNASVPAPVQYKIGYSNPSALSFAGGSLWSADWIEGKIYRQDPSSPKELKVTAEYTLPEIQPTGIAYDGKNIWVSSSLEGKIYKLSGDSKLTTEASFQSPGSSPSGLLFDEGGLWSLDFQGAKVYKHRIDDKLTVVSSYDSPAKNPCGIFALQQGLCIADASTGRIYCVSGDDFLLKGIYTLDGSGNIKISSAASDGKSIWICSDGTAVIHKFSVKSLKPVKL